MNPLGAAVVGASVTLGACLGVSAVLHGETRNDLADAAATLVTAPAVAALYPFREWGAHRLSPEALARFARQRFVSDGVSPLDPWVFALTRRTGLVWLRATRRPGDKVRLGSTPDFRLPIRVRGLFEGKT